jgi:hypothetical protein
VRLFDLFRGPHFTLLGFGPGADITDFGAVVQTHRIADPDGHVHRAYDICEDVRVLVRPDGYIGTITKNNVRGYLRDAIGLRDAGKISCQR